MILAMSSSALIVAHLTISAFGAMMFERPRRRTSWVDRSGGAVMSRVIADITVSLDGFVTGPHPDIEHGLGKGGEPLHTWAIDSDDPVDAAVLREGTEQSGAVVMGRRLFDIIDSPRGWNDEMGYGAAEVGKPKFFVVTHSEPQHVRLGLDFTFVTDGLDRAIAQARAAAGDKNVVVMGGGDVIRQCVDEALVDELSLHLAPILLGAGTPLFDGAVRRQLVQRSVRVSSTATHLIYDVNR
jgi:dihydrofolate reductase